MTECCEFGEVFLKKGVSGFVSTDFPGRNQEKLLLQKSMETGTGGTMQRFRNRDENMNLRFAVIPGGS
jgi:hypothetical protein